MIYEVFPPEIQRGTFARGLHIHEAAAMLSCGLGAAQVRAGLQCFVHLATQNVRSICALFLTISPTSEGTESSAPGVSSGLHTFPKASISIE